MIINIVMRTDTEKCDEPEIKNKTFEEIRDYILSDMEDLGPGVTVTVELVEE